MPFWSAESSIAGILLPILWNIILPTTVAGSTHITAQNILSAFVPISATAISLSELKMLIICGARP